MKKVITAGVISLMLMGGLAPLNANEKMMKDPAKMQEHMDDKLVKMTKELKLTPDQQSTVKAAMEAKMEKMKAAQEEFQSTVRASLTPDQVQKYDKMHEKK